MDRGYYLGLEFQNLWRHVVKREEWLKLVWQMRYAPYMPTTSYGLKHNAAMYAHAADTYQPDFPYLRYEDEPPDYKLPSFERHTTVPVYDVDKCHVPIRRGEQWYPILPAAHQRWKAICPRYRAPKIRPEDMAYNPTTEMRHKGYLEVKPDKPIEVDRNVEFPTSANVGDNRYKNLMGCSSLDEACAQLRDELAWKDTSPAISAPGRLIRRSQLTFKDQDSLIQTSFNRQTYMATHPRQYDLYY